MANYGTCGMFVYFHSHFVKQFLVLDVTSTALNKHVQFADNFTFNLLVKTRPCRINKDKKKLDQCQNQPGKQSGRGLNG